MSGLRQNRSWLEVEVLPAQGDHPHPGFERAACRDLYTDGTRREVAWQDARLSELPGGTFRLRFWLYGCARLDGYRFT